MHLCFCFLPAKKNDKKNNSDIKRHNKNDDDNENIKLMDEHFHKIHQNESNRQSIDRNSYQTDLDRQYSQQLSRQYSRRSSHMIEEDVERGMKLLLQNKRRKSSYTYNSQNNIYDDQKDLSSHLRFKNSLTYDELIIKSLEENVIIEQEKEYDHSKENSTISPLNSCFVSSKGSKTFENSK